MSKLWQNVICFEKIRFFNGNCGCFKGFRILQSLKRNLLRLSLGAITERLSDSLAFRWPFSFMATAGSVLAYKDILLRIESLSG